MSSKAKGDRSNSEHDGASPGKIFVGGLPKDTSMATFMKHFGKYGEIIDSVIMKDRHTQQPRGFGFITYTDPSVVDQVIEDTHIINGKQVEIKRTIPKGSVQSKDFKTKKIFVGGVPSTITDDEFKGFFSKYGKIVDHEIIRDHTTKRSRGFGFIIFESEKVVDDLVSKGNMIDLAGSQISRRRRLRGPQKRRGRRGRLMPWRRIFSQSVELLRQQTVSASASREEKRSYFSKIMEDSVIKLQQEHDWLSLYKQQIETSNLVKEHSNTTGELNLEDMRKKMSRRCQDLMRLVESKKNECEELKAKKSELDEENVKSKQIILQLKQKTETFTAALKALDVEALQEEHKALLTDEAGEMEYLKSLEDQIKQVKNVSHAVKCQCGEYKAELMG